MKILCVVPRYGKEVLGGAEALIRGFAEGSNKLGVETHVVTSCAVDAILWENQLPRGHFIINGVNVWRYPLEPIHSTELHQRLYYQLMTHQPIGIDEQYEWLDNGPHSPQLYAHIENYETYYDVIILSPYLFPIIQYATTIHPEKSVIWPCLHDEAFAKFESTRLMLSQALGVIYNSDPERDLAQHKLGIEQPQNTVAGIGVNEFVGNGTRFRQQYGLHEPFILYSGRLEPTKNVPLLLGYFLAYKREYDSDLKLVLMGRGPTEIPRHPDIIPIGFKQGQEKFDVYSAATILCQPSVLESFSIVIMESWLANVPVLVHAQCPVTSFHCKQSNGGLYFNDEDEFIECVNWFLSHPNKCTQLGQQGSTYVRQRYNWQAVIHRALSALEQWVS
jgi:glycosyltransferase involved in cell wall biosynthesis